MKDQALAGLGSPRRDQRRVAPVRRVEHRAAHHFVAHFLDKVLGHHRHLPGRMEADRPLLGVEEVHREFQHDIAFDREPSPGVPNGSTDSLHVG
jgi:hypothetical protein